MCSVKGKANGYAGRPQVTSCRDRGCRLKHSVEMELANHVLRFPTHGAAVGPKGLT
jgi:hypothetical protein